MRKSLPALPSARRHPAKARPQRHPRRWCGNLGPKDPRCRQETGLVQKGKAGPQIALLALGPGANRNATGPVAARM